MKLSVTEASNRLGVTGSRVRQLITAGDLPATRVGRAWVLDDADVERYSPRRQGRPITEASAWAFLQHLSGSRSIDVSREVRAQHERWAEHLRLLPDLDIISPFMALVRNRAMRTALAADREDLNALRSDERLVLSGISHPETHLLVNEEFEGYVARRDFNKIQREFLLFPPTFSRDYAPVVLHVSDSIPHPFPEAAVAADLAEHRGVREIDEAIQILRRLLD